VEAGGWQRRAAEEQQLAGSEERRMELDARALQGQAGTAVGWVRYLDMQHRSVGIWCTD
jgi:hypothetical protein